MMEASEFLGQYRKLKVQISRKQDELGTTNRSHTSGVDLVPVKHSLVVDRIEQDVICREKLREDLMNLQCDAVSAFMDIISVVNKIENINIYDVLHKYYLQEMKRTQIAEVTGFSIQWVDELLKRGRIEVQKILDSRE